MQVRLAVIAIPLPPNAETETNDQKHSLLLLLHYVHKAYFLMTIKDIISWISDGSGTQNPILSIFSWNQFHGNFREIGFTKEISTRSATKVDEAAAWYIVDNTKDTSS